MLAVLRNGVPSGGVLRRLQADVAGEVVQRARGDDGERETVFDGDSSGGGDAAVAAGHPQGPRPSGCCCLPQQFVDPGVRCRLQDLGARHDALDVGTRVVVVRARARVDRHYQARTLGQRRRLGGIAHPGRLLRPHPPPVLSRDRDGAAHGEARHDVPRVVHAHVHPRVADAQRYRRQRGPGQGALHRQSGHEGRRRRGVPAGKGQGARLTTQPPMGLQVLEVRTHPAEDPLEDDVDEQAGHAQRTDPADGPAPGMSLPRPQQDAEQEPQSPVVRGGGQPSQ
jgi:hypothetical protein